MQTEITSINGLAHSFVLELKCEKKEAVIIMYRNGRNVHVTAKNAAARLNRCMGGRAFWTVADALDAYKSPEMRAMIRHARAAFLDAITREQTAFADFEALLTAPGYVPILRAGNRTHETLAVEYDLEQERRGDSRRAFLA